MSYAQPTDSMVQVAYRHGMEIGRILEQALAARAGETKRDRREGPEPDEPKQAMGIDAGTNPPTREYLKWTNVPGDAPAFNMEPGVPAPGGEHYLNNRLDALARLANERNDRYESRLRRLERHITRLDELNAARMKAIDELRATIAQHAGGSGGHLPPDQDARLMTDAVLATLERDLRANTPPYHWADAADMVALRRNALNRNGPSPVVELVQSSLAEHRRVLTDAIRQAAKNALSDDVCQGLLEAADLVEQWHG